MEHYYTFVWAQSGIVGEEQIGIFVLELIGIFAWAPVCIVALELDGLLASIFALERCCKIALEPFYNFA